MITRTIPPALWLILTTMSGLVAAQGDAHNSTNVDEDALAKVLAAQQQRVDAIDKAMEAAICVFAPAGDNGGSGVVITPDGYALTNYHVVKPCGNFMKCSMADGRLYDAVIVGIDPVGDVALIKLFGRDDFPTATMADSDLVKQGDWCFAIGNPFLLATDFQPTVSYGIVSGVRRYQFPAGTLLEYADCIQTDAAINPGNSGGPLFNAEGHLIGINGRGSFEKRGRVNVGVGYAISINQIKHFLGCLRSGRILDHATLGATVSLDEEGRVVVTNILESSDAYRRGLRVGDELVFFGNRPIRTVNAFKNALGIYPRGWRVPLVYRREGERVETQVLLSGVHSPEELIEKVQGAEANPLQPAGGMPAPDDLPEQLRAQFEARSGFANFYFNARELERVWNQFISINENSLASTAIRLAGLSDDDRPVQFALSDDGAGVEWNGQAELLDLQEPLAEQLAPEGSGGLMLTLYAWQRMMSVGPEQFGEVVYFGTIPESDDGRLLDLLIGTFDTLEARFAFDPADGSLVSLEVFPDLNVDGCRIEFSDYRTVDGVRMPHRLEIFRGDQPFSQLTIETIELSFPATTPETRPRP